MMPWAVKIDHAAVESVCARLGINNDSKAKTRKSRAIILYALSKDIETLAALAEQNNVTLFTLFRAHLLPNTIATRVRYNAPVDKSHCTESNNYFHKEIGTLTEDDFARFSSCRNVGKNTVEILKCLVEVYRETVGFKILCTPLTKAGQAALLERIANAIRADTTIQRKLSAMFPR